MSIKNRTEFNGLLEERLRLEVVIPVFQQLGAKGLVDNHGTTELGKDLVGWFDSPTGSPMPFAVVLKAGNLSGDKIKEAADQVSQAFRTEFITGIDSSKRRAKTVYVITNGRVTNSAQERLTSLIDERYVNHIEVWNGDELWNKWTSLFPVTVEQLQRQVRDQLADMADEAIYAEAWVGESSHGIRIKVRDEAKLTDQHVKGSIRLSFPDTEEGRAAHEKYLDHLRTGSPLSLPGEFATIRMPEILEKVSQQFAPQALDFHTVEITPYGSDVRFPVKIMIENDQGESLTFDHIDWRMLQAGTEQVTFVNDLQNIPIRFQMTFDKLAGMANYDFTLSEDSVPATWVVKMMDLERLLRTGARMTITMLNTDSELISTSHVPSTTSKVDEDEYNLYRELAAIEAIIKQPILMPTPDLTEDDRTNLTTMRALLRSPEIHDRWTRASLTYLDDGSGATELAKLLDGEETALAYSGQSTLVFAGRVLHLGQFRRETPSARLENIDEVKREMLDADDQAEKELHLKLVPGEYDQVRTIFMDWIDAPAAAPYRLPTEQVAENDSGESGGR